MTKLNEELDELNKINEEMLTSIETLSEQNLANLKEIEVIKQENCSLELKMIQKSKREDQPKPVSPRKNRDGKISNRKTEKENKTYAASCEALRNINSSTDVELKEGKNFNVNNLIHKSNNKLYEYSKKLNFYANGDVSFLEINSFKGNKLNNYRIANNILNYNILSKKQEKNLKFVPISKHFLEHVQNKGITVL
ncbi:hypothetical protein JTB14_002072 [Gonioctena quinquepunctata]|nr:hypothetical protein JTB14_002072 [Gonioctena quinquepunctata]